MTKCKGDEPSQSRPRIHIVINQQNAICELMLVNSLTSG